MRKALLFTIIIFGHFAMLGIIGLSDNSSILQPTEANLFQLKWVVPFSNSGLPQLFPVDFDGDGHYEILADDSVLSFDDGSILSKYSFVGRINEVKDFTGDNISDLLVSNDQFWYFMMVIQRKPFSHNFSQCLEGMLQPLTLVVNFLKKSCI